jgi:hypothetical protein
MHPYKNKATIHQSNHFWLVLMTLGLRMNLELIANRGSIPPYFFQR